MTRPPRTDMVWTMLHAIGYVIGFTVMLIVALAVFVLPGAWLTMLAAGNFGLTSVSLVDCLPLGVLAGLIMGVSVRDE